MPKRRLLVPIALAAVVICSIWGIISDANVKLRGGGGWGQARGGLQSRMYCLPDGGVCMDIRNLGSKQIRLDYVSEGFLNICHNRRCIVSTCDGVAQKGTSLAIPPGSTVGVPMHHYLRGAGLWNVDGNIVVNGVLGVDARPIWLLVFPGRSGWATIFVISLFCLVIMHAMRDDVEPAG